MCWRCNRTSQETHALVCSTNVATLDDSNSGSFLNVPTKNMNCVICKGAEVTGWSPYTVVQILRRNLAKKIHLMVSFRRALEHSAHARITAKRREIFLSNIMEKWKCRIFGPPDHPFFSFISCGAHGSYNLTSKMTPMTSAFPYDLYDVIVNHPEVNLSSQKVYLISSRCGKIFC